MAHRYTFFRYLAYSLELILLFVLQTTPNLMPELFGSKPLMILPAVLTISYMESELPAMFFGLAGGLMLDFGYGDGVGFFTFTLTLICFGLSMFFRDKLVASFLNVMAFTAVISTALILAYFLFFYVIAGKGNALGFFVNHYISRIIYTIACEVILYFLNSFLYKNMRD